MQVDFVIGGTQKGGTTALAKFVAAHPQVAFSSAKETHFFDEDAHFTANTSQAIHPAGANAAGPAEVAAYHRFFAPTPATRMIGEATPIYMYWEACPGRIHRYNAGMRWIVLLRDPVERAHSHWVMEIGRGDEMLPFGQALRAEEARLAKAGGQHRHWSYRDRGRYAGQLERLFRLFGRERVLVLLTEDLRERHGATLARVWDFLEVDRIDVPAERVFAQHYAEMEPAERDWLAAAFAPEIDRLEELLGRPLVGWRESAAAQRSRK